MPTADSAVRIETLPVLATPASSRANFEDIVVVSRGPGVAARGVTSVEAGTESPPAGASDAPAGSWEAGAAWSAGATIAARCGADVMLGAIEASDTIEPGAGINKPGPEPVEREPPTGAITLPTGPVTGASTRVRSLDVGASTGPITGASVFVTGASVSA